jgi:hypothetical protein
MARKAYRQWDRQEDPAEIVFRAAADLKKAIISDDGPDGPFYAELELAEGPLVREDYDHLLEGAEAWFRSEAEHLFGADYVVVGQ